MIEYSKPYFMLFFLLFAMIWSFDYLKILRKTGFNLPKIFFVGRKLFLRTIIFIVGIGSILLMGYGSMQPKKILGISKNTIDAKDIFLVVDVSESMRTSDFEPNRLEAAKKRIVEFVQHKSTDRVGVIIFSEKVFTLLPLTTDFELIKESIAKIQIGYLGSGTNIGDAIGLASARLAKSLAKSKIIILLTDGVSNVGSITPEEASDQAKDLGVKIYAIGIGRDKKATTSAGVGNFGTMRFQRVSAGDFDLAVLEKISKITGGKSFSAADDKSLSNVLNEIDKLEKTQIESKGKIIYEELYWPYFVLGFVLFIMSELSRRFILKEGV